MFFLENSLFQWFSVINTACRKDKIQDFPFVVDYQVQFKSKFADVVQIVMLETAEPSRIEVYEDYDYLGIAYTIGLAAVALAINWSF